MRIWYDPVNIVSKFSIVTCLFKETQNSVRFQKKKKVLISQF